MYNDNFITCDTLIQYGHKHEHENVQECGHDPGQYSIYTDNWDMYTNK